MLSIDGYKAISNEIRFKIIQEMFLFEAKYQREIGYKYSKMLLLVVRINTIASVVYSTMFPWFISKNLQRVL